MKTYRNLNKLIALTSALILSGAFLARAEESKVQLMFVQTAEDFKADGKTLRLVNVGQQTLYFSDRPVRIAGHLTMPAYMDEWKASEGPDNFSNDPPNATLSVYEWAIRRPRRAFCGDSVARGNQRSALYPIA